MLFRLILLVVFFSSGMLRSQTYTGPIAIPTSGYGSLGSFLVDSVTFNNPSDPSDTSYVYYPVGTSSPVPTVFFMAGNGGISPVYYRPYFEFIVSKGYAVVFVPVPTSQPVLTRYANMRNGFVHAARTWPQYIDTTRVGFAGHSFGGGACFGISYGLFTDFNWGSNGRFLMPTAQWYSYDIAQTELQNFPANTYLLSFIFQEDVVCDHRMAIDIFNNISIPVQDKDIVYASSSVEQSYNYRADHVLPNTSARYDAMDYYVLYRLTDAMMDFVFAGNVAAKTVALGDGDNLQVQMPAGLNTLLVADTLSPWYPQSTYGYPCTSGLNPRVSWCGVITSVRSSIDQFSVFPIPAQEFLFVYGAAGSDYTIVNSLGETVLAGTLYTGTETINISTLAPAVYFLNCGGQLVRIIKQ